MPDRRDGVRALVELGALHLERGDFDEARQWLQRAVSEDSEHLRAHVLLSRAYHLLGDHSRGLEEFAWLTHPRTLRWRAFAQPLWDGSNLEGRTILVWTRPNSGLGDAIQFLRYAALVQARGGTVVVECHRDLVALAPLIRGVDLAVAQGTPLPFFDVHVPLPRLPVLLGGVPWPLPADGPYISIRSELVEQWRRYLDGDGRMTVGLVWAGDPKRPDASVRFTTVASFACLGQIPGIRLVSLQVGPQVVELNDPPEGLSVSRLPIELSTPLEEKAALVLNLDLMITVDTMMAHLAGALGRRVWTVLAYSADWRWLQGDSTPWYPTMRLFRQTRAGDWQEVAERVAHALAAHVAGVSR